MVNFKQWFFEGGNRDIFYSMWGSNGDVMVHINGVPYTFNVPAHLHRNLKIRSKRAPYVVLRELQRLDPKPTKGVVDKSYHPDPPNGPTQRELF